jgi:hypothetical protein
MPISRVLARHFSLSSRSFGRHPVIHGRRSAGYAPEFALNRQVAETLEPWVPKEKVKSRDIEKKKREFLHSKQLELATLQDQLKPVLVTDPSSPSPMPMTVTEAPAQPPPHPDPLIHYNQQVQYMRMKYAYEIQLKREAEQAQNVVQSSEGNEESQTSTDAQDGDRENTASSLLQEQCTDALQLLEMVCHKEMKTVKHQALLRQHAQKRRQHVVALYQASKDFICPENLDAKIDACLEHVTPHASMNLKEMKYFAMERVRQDREDKLYDVLNETFQRGPSVEEIGLQRQRELEAAVRELA